MKESKVAVSGNLKNSTAEEMDPKKKIELLEKKLTECRKRRNSKEENIKSLQHLVFDLSQQNSILKAVNKSERDSVKFWMKLYGNILDTMKISSENYCNLIKKYNNLHPGTNSDIEYHKAELEKIVNMLSSLIKESNLLGSHSIGEFLSNQN